MKEGTRQMGQIVIRARDSVTALELVERRLGSDALILSSRSIDGQVEVIATDGSAEAATAPRRTAPTDPPRAAQRVDLWIGDTPEDAPQPEPEPVQQTAPPKPVPPSIFTTAPMPPMPAAQPVTPASVPAAPMPDTGATGTQDENGPDNKNADAVLNSAEGRTDEAAEEGADFAADMQRRLALRAPRIVLCGPVGVGKSVVALQLALLRAAEASAETLEIAFCGTGSRADGALLAQKSHLLGMTCKICPPDDLSPPRAGVGQIVVISGREATGPGLMRAALSTPDACGLLCLPGGLRADRVAGIAAHWAGASAGVILCGSYGAPDQSDRRAARAAGLTPLWSSAPDLLVGGLADHPPKSVASDMSMPLFRHRPLKAEPAQ